MVISGLQRWACFFCLLLAPFQGLAGIPLEPAWELSQEEAKRINAGEIVTRAASEEGYVRKVEAFLLFKAPVELVFSVITDYENLPEFMPNLERVEVLETSEEGALVNYMLGLPFGVQKRYRLKLDYGKEKPNLRMSWDLVPWKELKPEETIVSTSGYWLLKPLENKDTTLLVYHTKTDPGDVPFGLGWIVDYLTNKTVVELLEKTKERAEKKWAENQVHSN